MPTITPQTIAELRELMKESTAYLKWEVREANLKDPASIEECRTICDCRGVCVVDDALRERIELIAAAINNLPALLDAATECLHLREYVGASDCLSDFRNVAEIRATLAAMTKAKDEAVARGDRLAALLREVRHPSSGPPVFEWVFPAIRSSVWKEIDEALKELG